MKKVKKVLSAVLVSALLMQSVAVPVSAAEDPFEAAAPTAGESIRPENAPEGSKDNLQVLYEVEEQREAAVKHFRLSDGSYVAASYPTAVHYAVGEDEWEEIDNTLNLVSGEDSQRSMFSSGGQVYQAVNGENEKSYAAVLEPDEELLSLQNSDFGLHMAILSSETAEDLLETAEPMPTPTPAPEEPSSSENPQEPEESKLPVESSDEISEEASEPSASSEVSSELESLAAGSMETELAEVYAGEFSENGETTELEGEEVSDVIPEETAGPGDSSEESSIPDASGSSDVGESESSPLPSESEPESPVVESEPEPTPLPTPDPTEEPSGGSSMASVPAKVENPDEAESPEPPGGEGDMPGEGPGPGPGDEPAEPVESVEEQVQPDKISSKVTYENVLPGVDLVYQNYGFNVKESIVIKSQQDTYQYSFLLNFDGLTPVLEPNGGVSLKNSQDEVIYQIPAPYMVDANQAVSYDASYELALTEQGYVLTVTVDEAWMDSAERAYPISIDPTFILYGGDYQGSITATSLTEGSSVTGAGGESIYIGTDYAGREMQAFLQFGKLPTLPSNCTVATAVLGMYQHTYSTVGMNRLYVRAHEVTGERPSDYTSAAQWIRSMTWNTRPAFSSDVEAYARMGSGNEDQYVEWDISRIVSKWYSRNQEDRLLAMDAIGPEAFTSSKYAASVFWMNVNYTPIFLIYYQNNVGIEDRFTYQTIPVDRAGTAYVGDFTEQLTAEVPLFSSNNEVLPFTITAYYNSPYHGRYFTQNDAFGMHTANYTTMNVGSGWKLSVQETVMKTTVETDNVSTDYYVYTDADGTEHYFEEKSPAPYEDEEGLGYSLSVSGTTYTLSDEKGNKKEFINGYLTRNTTDGNHLATTNDINNITSTYAYDGLGRLTSRTTPSEAGNLKVNQTYVDGSLNRINSNYISGILSLANTYDQGALVAASRKTFEGSTPQWQRYNTPVDAWNNITSVQVQGGNNVDAGENVTWYNPITLASFTFEPNGGPVTQMVYGNGDTEAYSYDLYGQLSSVHYSSNLLDYVEAFGYDAYGNVARSVITDSAGNALADYQYEYDSLGRLIRSQQSGDDITALWTQHEYDSQNRLSDQYWGVSDSTLHESFTYNSNNGTLSSMLLGTGRTLSFEYDSLLRVSRRNVSGVYQHRRNYIGTGIANRQSNRIQYFVYASADGADTKLNYRYDYDAGGNISEIYRSVGSDTLAFFSSYEYDTLSRLVKATDSRGTETYTYNTAGNMLSRTLAGDTVTYSYDNSSWNDLLTAYDGQKIAYEGQTYNSSRNSVSGTAVSGNPVSYYNGKRWNMEWVNGNRLAEASSGTTNVSYTYDRTGLRSTKTVNGTTYHYAYAGDKLVWQEWDGNEMFFFYDESNAPIGFWYHPASGSNVTGYYMTTQQGDITRIEDVNGNVLATYEYDAWGKLISSSGSLATINPLRYRGYYYDTETELYYLSNRYYDPKVSRFINADSTDAVLSANGLYDQNLFAYCDNNPVMRADNEGGFWHVLVGAAIGGAINVVTKGITNIMEGEVITKGLVSGFVSGAASGALASIAWPAKIASYVPAIMTAGNAVISAAEEWWDQTHSGEKTVNISDIVTSGVIGGISGALGGTGNGLSQVSKLSNNTVSRVYQAGKHNGIKAGIKEASKAMRYYGKSTDKFYTSYIKRTVPQDLGTSVAFGIAGSVIGGNNRVVNRFLNRVFLK